MNQPKQRNVLSIVTLVCLAVGLFFTGLSLKACSLFEPAAESRVTTQQERDQANTAISLVELAVTTAGAAGKLTPEQLTAAAAEIAVLRAFVQQSETTPVTIADLALRVATITARWTAAKEAAK
jgi:hypothetical protein